MDDFTTQVAEADVLAMLSYWRGDN